MSRSTHNKTKPSSLLKKPKLNFTRLTVWLFAFITLVSFFQPIRAVAQTACPTRTVKENQVGRYVYHLGNRNNGACTVSVAIPANGVRVYSSWADCRNGHLTAAGENGGGIVPSSLTCTNCVGVGRTTARVAPGNTANFRAYIKFDGGTSVVRYDGQFTRSATAPYQCTLSGTYRGSTFGGDATRPTVSIAPLTGPVNGKYTAVITLSEPSTNFSASDLTLENATAVISGAGSVYSATLTPSSDGEVAVTVAAKSFSDASDNSNKTASNRVNATFVGAVPTVNIAALVGPVNGKYTAEITLSESSNDFAVADLALTNATATLSGSGTSYTANLTPNVDGTVKLSVPASVFTVSGRGNTASNEVTAQFDGTGPDVEISGMPDNFLGTTEFAVTISFSEDVTQFDASDITAVNALVSALSGSGKVFSATIKPSGNGDISLTIPADKAFDAAGNGNKVSNTATITNKTVEETQKQISQFIAGRANQLLANQPNLICFAAGNCADSNFDASITIEQASIDLSSRRDHPFWFNFKASHSKSGTAKSDYIFGVLGTHWEIAPKTVLGIIGQFDHTNQTNGASKVSGTGWLVGPNLTGQFSPSHPLFYEVSALWGQTYNKINPLGTYADHFRTDRLLVRGKIAGQLKYDSLTLIPNVSGAYTQDAQKRYADSLGNIINKQKIKLAQLAFGLDFNTPLIVGTQTWLIGGGLAGIYSSTKGNAVTSSNITPFDGMRGRIHLSAGLVLSKNGKLSIGTFYDGIGVSQFEAYGFNLGMNFRF